MTKEMKKHFRKRTDIHIDLFRKYFKRIIALEEKFKVLEPRLKKHDISKFKEPEYTPYVYITGSYKCKRDGVDFEMPKKMQERSNNAIIHHITTNKHHPEYWDENFRGEEMFNLKDRDDVPKKIVDATKMKTQYIAEMIADWCAVSEEKNTNPMDGLNMNINKRGKFTSKQIEIMKFLIEKIGEK